MPTSYLAALISVVAALAATATSQSSDHAKARPSPSISSSEVLREHLLHGSTKEIAWAAYHAGKQHKTDLAIDLRLALAALRKKSPSTSDASAAARSILDAILQVRARIPTTELAPWCASFPTMTTVAMAQDAVRHAGLLLRCIERKQDHLHWFVACNTLVEKVPDMAISALLPLASVTLAVTVVTPGKYASIGTGIGGAIGCGQSKRIKGFPPVAEYKLARGRPDVREKEPRTLIAEGIEPISIIRREHTAATYLVHNLRRQINADHPDYALRCLQKLAGIPADEHQLRSVVERNCEWTTPQALLDDLNDFEEDLRGQYQSVLTKLADKSLLPRKHADEVQLPIEFRLVDLRDLSDKKEPLPKVKNR